MGFIGGKKLQLRKMILLTAAVIIGCIAGGRSSGYDVWETRTAAAAGRANAPERTEVEYWRFEAKGILHPPIVLNNGKLLAVASNGWVTVVNGHGLAETETNLYTSLSAPAADGQAIWFGGKGARLYRYEASGIGKQAAIFYFKGKTEGLQPSPAITDGQGIPYMAYQRAVLSLDAEGVKQTALLPQGVSVKELAAGNSGAYALGSNGTLYAVRGSEVLWEAKLDQRLSGARLAADPDGGAVLLAGKALAAYEADGEVRFIRELAGAPAGGWSSLALLGSRDDGVAVAAELGGGGIAAFRLDDGAERWRISARAAGGFGPAALAPDPAAGHVLAGARSGAVYAIDGFAGSIAYTYGGHAAVPAGGVAPLGGGRIAYASAAKLIAAGPVRPVAIAYPAASVKLPLDQRLLLADKLKLSAPVAVSYRSDNPTVVRVSGTSVVTPVSAGKATLYIDVASASYSGQLKLPVQVTASASKLKAKREVRKVAASGQSFTVQTVVLPKGMPLTAGLAGRKIGAVQPLQTIAKAYNADAAVNATYFEAYGGIPEPYGMVIADGSVEHIGNTGTSIGFTWDGKVLMDTLRVKISGATNGSCASPNNWYAYFINRTPAAGASSAILFTPKRGARLGFAMGSAVTVRKGIVTKISKKTNESIPSDGYVLVFTGAEEKLAARFKVGTKVDYKLVTTSVSGKPVDWSRAHTAVGAGPRLVKDGKLAVSPAGEGFTSSKILTDAAARSAILVKKDGTVIVATVPKATMKQWGQIMLQLGAQQAMNLDGGASSGLYVYGKYSTVPGRSISNALVFGKKLKW